MNVNLAYRGRSAVTSSPAGLAVSLAPNLRRDRVSFEGVLRDPLHFREAVGALHDVVVCDLRYKPRDKSAFEAYKAEQKRREVELRTPGHQAGPSRDPGVHGRTARALHRRSREAIQTAVLRLLEEAARIFQLLDEA